MIRWSKRMACVAIALSAVSACGGTAPSLDETDVDDGVGSVTDAVDDLLVSLRNEGLDSAASAVATIDMSAIVGDDQFTFLAPSNEAFFAIEADELADLLADPEQVAGALRNHVILTAVLAEELRDGSSVEAASGRLLEVSVDGDEIRVGGVAVVVADVATGHSGRSEGVIHVVDGLILE